MILSFKPEIVKPILKGTKIHSIRKDKHQRWKPGMRIHFATGARTKNYNQFRQGTCCSVQTIAMDFNHYPSIFIVDGKRLSINQKMKLVENDGFKTYLDFWKFFAKPADKYIFMGVIIHWTGFRYHHDKKGFIYGNLPIIMDLPGEVDELPKHLQDWMDVDWSKSEPPLCNPFKVDHDITKPLVLTPIGTKKFTREQLKEIRKSYKEDHAYDALRYGALMPKQEKKVGLFGRIIAWIKSKFRRK